MLSLTLRHNVGFLVTYLRLLHVFSTNKYNAQVSWLFQYRITFFGGIFCLQVFWDKIKLKTNFKIRLNYFLYFSVK